VSKHSWNRYQGSDSDKLVIPYPEPLVTKADVGHYFAVSPRTISGWVAARRIPFLKLGRLVRFRLRDVEKALAKQIVEASCDE
jgi:excisionase family DNA binding protein